MGLCLSAVEVYSLDGKYCGNYEGPVGVHSDCYLFQKDRRTKIGFALHVFTVLPAGILAVFQFVPAIRHKALLYHRMAGYTAITLMFVANAGAVIMSQEIHGGTIEIRALVGIVALMTTGGLVIAVYNIKKQQLDQHRAWMLRSWFWLGFIVTLRILQGIMISILGVWPWARYDTPMPCDQILFVMRQNASRVYETYPACAPANIGLLTNGMTLVTTDPSTDIGLVACLYATFIAAGSLALLMHAVGIEIYLSLTPREAQRLREISYERQLERGMRYPGSAGLVTERLGDADPWRPRWQESCGNDPNNNIFGQGSGVVRVDAGQELKS